MNDFILKANNLGRTFSQGRLKVKVLQNINLQIKKSETVAIIGASGSGKSTLLHLLGGLDTPDSGKIMIANENILKMSETEISAFRNQHIGFVYQFHHLLPEFSAVENIAMPLWIQGVNKDKAKSQAERLLEKVELAHRSQHRPAELSGGERQRIAIARALVTRPSIILADEPTGNLDNKTANKVFELILKLNEEIGTAMIIVTHDTELAANMDSTFELRNKSLHN